MEKTSNYYGCVDSLSKDDPRLETYKSQRETRGFDDTEVWSLDIAMFSFLHPRLRRLIELRRKTFGVNERTDELEKLCKILDVWAEGGTDSLLPPEAYELLSNNMHNMWY